MELFARKQNEVFFIDGQQPGICALFVEGNVEGQLKNCY
jgi:hypothetical protein